MRLSSNLIVDLPILREKLDIGRERNTMNIFNSAIFVV